MVGCILLVFCCTGAVTYRVRAVCSPAHTRAQYFDTQCTFVDALFIAFNLVANLTMAEMTAANSLLAVVYIVCFVTFGLVVLGMCGDLALAG